jgi:hypothetical protein
MKWFLVALFVLLSSPLHAEYDYPGAGYYVDTKGQKHHFDFGLALLKQSDRYVFRLGKQEIAVSESPKRYTLALVLNDQQHIWVPDFTKEPVTAFTWQIGQHQLKLQQETVKQGYVLQIGEHRYQFTAKKRGQIHFTLTENGISDIRVESMLMLNR